MVNAEELVGKYFTWKGKHVRVLELRSGGWYYVLVVENRGIRTHLFPIDKSSVFEKSTKEEYDVKFEEVVNMLRNNEWID